MSITTFRESVEATRESDQRIGVLHLLTLQEPLHEQPFAPQPPACPNCGGVRLNLKSPYCGERCKEEAAWVRQARAALANGMLADPERQKALGQQLWRVLGGGLPARRDLIPPKTLVRILEKKGGRCEVCGEPATTVDHTGSG